MAQKLPLLGPPGSAEASAGLSEEASSGPSEHLQRQSRIQQTPTLGSFRLVVLCRNPVRTVTGLHGCKIVQKQRLSELRSCTLVFGGIVEGELRPRSLHPGGAMQPGTVLEALGNGWERLRLGRWGAPCRLRLFALFGLHAASHRMLLHDRSKTAAASKRCIGASTGIHEPNMDALPISPSTCRALSVRPRESQ